MAKVYGLNSQMRGKVGTLIFRNTKNGTVVYEAPARKTPKRSEKQMKLRTQWANLGAVYRQFNQTLLKAFENLPTGMSEYNAFVQANIGLCKVYLSKNESLNGGSVLAPYQISRGSLQSIEVSTNDEHVLMSDIALGLLEIDENTTVGELSAAIISNNEMWEEGDMLTFFYGKQSVDAVTQVPRAKITGFRMVLNLSDDTPVWDAAGAEGFSSVNGYLGMSGVITDGAAAWIHSRENGGALQVSTQFLHVDSSVLEAYQMDSAFNASAESYGGVNSRNVYLEPGSAEG